MQHPDYQDISRRFRQRALWRDAEPLEFAPEGVGLFFLACASRGAEFLLGHERYVCAEHGVAFPGEPTTQWPPDHTIRENLDFRYPLVRDHARGRPGARHTRGILLLHGLNERSFTKFAKYRPQLANARLTHWLECHSEGTWLQSFCGLRPERARLDARLRVLAPRLLGIANSNDQVMPAGAMYNALQGIRRDIPVRVEELALGIHEHPFVSSHYVPHDRAIITESLNEPHYGAAFERFIALTTAFLAP